MDNPGRLCATSSSLRPQCTLHRTCRHLPSSLALRNYIRCVRRSAPVQCCDRSTLGQRLLGRQAGGTSSEARQCIDGTLSNNPAHLVPRLPAWPGEAPLLTHSSAMRPAHALADRGRLVNALTSSLWLRNRATLHPKDRAARGPALSLQPSCARKVRNADAVWGRAHDRRRPD